MKAAFKGRPIVFGEVLFDRFGNGASVLGGAPFNVAWHLQGFGLDPLFIGRIGTDALGAQVQQAMAGWGMDQAGLQHDREHPTGTVKISLREGQPDYTLLPRQAYDFIDADTARQAVEQAQGALLYHGSLAARHATSSKALHALRRLDLPCFVDLNLRTPWWKADNLVELIRGTRWLKLNDAELDIISAQPGDRLKAAAALRRQHGIELLTVTLGADGAWLVTEQETLRAAAAPVEVVDTVGAGDAFSAAMLLGIWRGWPLALSLHRAVEFAADICRQRGATRHDPDFYSSWLERWQASDKT